MRGIGAVLRRFEIALLRELGYALMLAEEANQKIEEMRRGGAQAESIAQYETLLRTIEADGVQSRQAQQLALEG